ncbi:hypothetical protein NK983_26390, partial [Salmonella enterica subsp. enterica serovar Typhimurium]|nr:hypothetical protein [Salmonella enterica subsp. enterica serovar Typhimurium]
IILEARGVQQVIQMSLQLRPVHSSPVSGCRIMQRLWLVFAQSVTAALAVLFVVATLKPEWLPSRSTTVPNGTPTAPSISTLLPEPPPVTTRIEAAKVVSYA